MLNKIKYILLCVLEMNFNKFFSTVKTVSKISDKNYVIIFFDIIYSGLIYGCGYKDYSLYEFYKLKRKERKTYITRGVNNSYVKKLNNPAYYSKFNNKEEFLNIFSDYIGRTWISTKNLDYDKFTKFINNNENIIIKPVRGSCGVDIEKIEISAYINKKVLYTYIMNKGEMIIEELIIQHQTINKLNPYSVNTLRITTVKGNIVYAFIRIGNSRKPIDNINAGGMAAPINIETGVINGVGYDKKMKSYENHPITQCKIEGLKIPFWNDVLILVTTISKIIPQIGYVGWDIAITQRGPILVEGNCHPGHDILQLPAHTHNKIGMIPEFNKYL